MKYCNCGKQIPDARLKAMPGATTCVDCSKAEKKVGVPVTFGQGDHTWTELNIMNEEEHVRFERLKKRYGE